MSLFAGFWVDGAVRKPEQRHCDSEDTVIARWKRNRDREQTLGVSNEFDICHRYFPSWDEVFWLDTTPRESLTPEELFSVLKVIWPKTQVVNNPEGGAIVGWQVPHDATDDATPIEWGGLTRYPPDLDWVRVTKDNVSQHLFKDCRWRSQWGELEFGKVAGWDSAGGRCLVTHPTGIVSSQHADARVKGAE